MKADEENQDPAIRRQQLQNDLESLACVIYLIQHHPDSVELMTFCGATGGECLHRVIAAIRDLDTGPTDLNATREVA